MGEKKMARGSKNANAIRVKTRKKKEIAHTTIDRKYKSWYLY